MKSWKTAGFAAALVGAAGLGAAVVPVADAQSARAVAPRAVEVFGFGSGRIGVSVSDVDAQSGKSAGVLVESVDEDSPAAKAGLRKGDTVVEFDGERVRSVRQFTRLVTETPVGRTVPAVVLRDGQRITLNVTPREAESVRLLTDEARRRARELRDFSVTVPRVVPPERDFQREIESLLRPGSAQLGITIDDLSPQLAEYFGAKDGVLVSSVRAESLGATMGLRAGDVITAVNGATVDTASELRRQLSRLEPGEEFTLGIVRDKKAATLKGKTESRTPRRWTSRTIL